MSDSPALQGRFSGLLGALARDPRMLIRYPDILVTLGKDYEQMWLASCRDNLTRVQNTDADPELFGPIPAARTFGLVYGAAATTYEATLRGIQQDLVDAATALADAAAEMHARDENAGAAFTSLSGRWSDPGGFASDQAYDEAQLSPVVHEGGAARAEVDRTAPDGGPAQVGSGGAGDPSASAGEDG